MRGSRLLTLRVVAFVPALFLLVALSSPALGAGMDEVGNAPVNELNYDEWQGTDILPVLNHTSRRVYRRWVNGNEHFYYSGDAKALSNILEKFSAVKLDTREVEIRPGPAGTSMFDGTAVPYDWRLHLLTGIAASFGGGPGSEIELGEKNPTLAIFVGSGNFALKDVTVPVGITLVGPDELRERYLVILRSDDDERKQAAHALVRLDPTNADNIPVFLKMIGEGGEALYAAADGLEKMGRNAKSALPAMKELAEGQDELARTRLLDAIDAIEAAPDTSEKDSARLEILAQIRGFIARTKLA
ncbi:MAG: hypothetical protein ACYTAN_18870, partial [Planctomycetota bacterium]